MIVLHTLDNSNRGGIQELILNLHKYSRHRHDFVAADGSMAAEIRAARMILFNGVVPAELKYDVVIGHTVGGWSGENGSEYARRMGGKFVECMHSIYRSPTPPELCDGFIALSDLALEQNRQFQNATRIYGILDSSKFGVHLPDRKKVGRLSRLANEKGVMEFLFLSRSLPQYQFVCGGDGNMMAEMRTLKPGNLELPGWISDKPAFMDDLALFAFPTRDECCCMSVAQAQMAGVPVICSDIPALRETTGGHAFFFNDYAKMAAQIETYFRDQNTRDLFERVAIEGREWAFKNFDKSVTIKAWDDYLEDL